jgi:hypothetical protein
MEKEANPDSGTSSTPHSSGFLTLQKAIELGEYEPEVLARYPEWSQLSTHGQLQLIRKGLDNREFQLKMEWAEIANVLDYSKKPHLAEVLKRIDVARKKLYADRERLYMEYTKDL